MKTIIAYAKGTTRDGYGDVYFSPGDKIRVRPDKVKGWYTDGNWVFPRSALHIPRTKKK